MTRGNRFPVSVSLDHATLHKLDRLAALTGHNRSSLLRCLVSSVEVVPAKFEQNRIASSEIIGSHPSRKDGGE